MRSSDPLFKLLARSFSQESIIAIPRALLTLVGDIKTTLLLGQIIYWSDIKSDEDGWFYKSYVDWEEEIALTKHEVARSTEDLKNVGVVETRVAKIQGAPTVHYRLLISGFRKWIVEKAEMESKKTGNLKVKKTEILIQKNTTEEYSQKTTDTSSGPAPSRKTEPQNQPPSSTELSDLEPAPPPSPPPACVPPATTSGCCTAVVPELYGTVLSTKFKHLWRGKTDNY